MTPQEFVHSSVEKLSKHFPQLCISYEFDQLSTTHFVKIVPGHIYDTEEFMNLEAEIYTDWFEKVDDVSHSFCIVSSNSLAQLSNEEVLYQGKPALTISLIWEQAEIASPVDAAFELQTISTTSHDFKVVGLIGFSELAGASSSCSLAA